MYAHCTTSCSINQKGKFKMAKPSSIFCWILSLALVVQYTEGHGRLVSPPARATMWRYGFNTTVNYNDHQLFCGGSTVQEANDGKCGVCGDNYNDPQPRTNENGGKYGQGVIVVTYTQGQVIEAIVQITVHHKGWFDFKVCKLKQGMPYATEECMDENLLVQTNGATRYPLPNTGPMDYKVILRLPAGVTCEQCVFRWRYHTGNSWGCDAPNDCGLGKGHQEEFYGCADIRIVGDATGEETFTPQPTHITETVTASSTTVPSGGGTEIDIPNSEAADRKKAGEDVHCVSDGDWAGQQPITVWCMQNCFAPTPYCPESHCRCFIQVSGGSKQPVFPKANQVKVPNLQALAKKKAGENVDCNSTGLYKGQESMTIWCRQNCFAPVPYCPASHCECMIKL